ncbi:MAG: hypothetical protein CTY39_02950, partial [Hyphomicrobium sp.]
MPRIAPGTMNNCIVYVLTLVSAVSVYSLVAYAESSSWFTRAPESETAPKKTDVPKSQAPAPE